MMNDEQYRLDIVGLASSETLPPTTNLEDGSTYYTVDTQELYVLFQGTWYNQTNPESQSDDSDDSEETPVETNNGEMR
jgi:hypothetical protein